MNKFALDYNDLEDVVDKKRYKLSEVKHLIEKIAFDVVKFKTDDPDKLWQIQSGDDGEYIIALYDNTDDKKVAVAASASSNVKTATQKSPWTVSVNKSASDLNVFYKGEPVVKIAAKSLGFDSSDMDFTVKYLGEKLASNKLLRDALLLKVDEKFRSELYKKYPELG